MFVLFLLLSLLFSAKNSSCYHPYYLKQGSSFSVENEGDLLISKNGVFSAGFYKVGQNAFCFSVWYSCANDTVVWMANRDRPVNGKHTKLSLQKSGNLIIKDAGLSVFWSIENNSNSSNPVQLQLNDTGNLVLHTLNGRAYGDMIWQSFDSPTDTLLPNQALTRERRLVASRSGTNYSSGFYKLIFSDDNILSLVFNGLETDSVYWPDNSGLPWEVGRTSYNESRNAVLDSYGSFVSSDRFNFTVGDYGIRQESYRRLVLDSDGNIRVYSLNEKRMTWDVQWQAFSQPCKVHGICGENSLCSYGLGGRKCSCLPGYKMKNSKDWSTGCEPQLNYTCREGSGNDHEFIQIPHVEFNGYGMDDYQNYTLDQCRKQCLNICSCIAFYHLYNKNQGLYVCNLKALLLNGYKSSSVDNSMYIKLPRSVTSSSNKGNQESELTCVHDEYVLLDRLYKKKHENRSGQSIFWFTIAFGGFQIFCILVYKFKARGPSHTNSSMQKYHQVATGFKRFTYSDLKKASQNFNNEIGKGGGGIVYKAVLPDGRIAAIKRLNSSDEQGEAEFLAEVNVIVRLNHMNLIEIWDYGIVMLELITGRSPMTTTSTLASSDSGLDGEEQRGVMSFVREKIREGAEIIDPNMNGAYDSGQLELLLKVAMQCAEDKKDARPSMSQVVDMLRFNQD
ncbi:hypothetical protein ACET3Z_016759 [Daucus carota]